MARGRSEPTEDVIASLELLRRGGTPIKDACRELHIGTETFYRWKQRAESGEGGVFAEFHARVLQHRKQGHGQPVVPDVDWHRIDYFEEWSHDLILDSGEPWQPEPWQLEPVEDLLSDLFQAIWLVVPEANGKTVLTAGVVLFLLEHQLTPEIPIGSATVTQADTLFRQIEGFIIRSGKEREFNIAPGVRRIDCRATRGHARVYPHNERSGDGVIPSGSVLDEGHLHPDLRLYRTWKGKYRKRRGPVFLISTAGEPASEFEDLRGKLLAEATELREDGAHIRAVSGSTVLHDWAVRNREQAEDMNVVAAANPLSSITAEELAEKRAEPEMTLEHWLRRTCNIASRVEGQEIAPEDWDALQEDELSPSPESWKVGWLDLGWRIDTTAMGILAWESRERRLIVGVRILEPPVDEGDIVAGLVYLQSEFGPEGFVYDPNAGGRQMVQLLEKGEHPGQGETEFVFIEHSQDNAPMSLAATRFDEALRNGWLRHDGHSGLRRHVLNSVRKGLGAEKWKYDRPPTATGRRRQKFPIDALTGVLMGHSVAVAEMDKADARTSVAHFL